MQILAAKLQRTTTAFVFIEVPEGKTIDDVTAEMLNTAIAATLEPEDWVPDGIELESLGWVADAASLDISIYRPFAERPTISERADQIGVAEGTLHRWRREGVDVFSDDAVKARIRKTRRWIPGLSDKFKLRLSGELLRKS